MIGMPNMRKPPLSRNGCRPKRLLPCRAFVTDLCGVNVPWRYQGNMFFGRPNWYIILKVKFGWGTHELDKAICVVAFHCVWVVFGGVSLVLITWWSNLVINLLYIIYIIYIWSKAILFVQWRQVAVLCCFLWFFGDSAKLYCFRYLCSRFMNFGTRLGRDCKETFNPKRPLNKKMCLLYNGNGNQTCIIPRLPEALPILFKRSGFKGILHP